MEFLMKEKPNIFIDFSSSLAKILPEKNKDKDNVKEKVERKIKEKDRNARYVSFKKKQKKQNTEIDDDDIIKTKIVLLIEQHRVMQVTLFFLNNYLIKFISNSGLFC
jgi:hypothetical protein